MPSSGNDEVDAYLVLICLLGTNGRRRCRWAARTIAVPSSNSSIHIHTNSNYREDKDVDN